MSKITPSDGDNGTSLPFATPRYLVTLLLTVVAYWVVAKLSLKLAFLQDNSSPVWPPSGLAIGLALVMGYRYVPAIFVGAFLVNLSTFGAGELTSTLLITALLSSTGVAIGNALEAFLGAHLTNRHAEGRFFLESSRTIFRFVAAAAFLPPLVSAGIGVTSLYLGGRVDQEAMLPVFITWLTGNIVGILTVTPLILSLDARRSNRERPWVRRPVESLILVLLLVTLSLGIFGRGPISPLEPYLHPYMMVLLIFWSALRLGQRFTLGSILVLSALLIFGTVAEPDAIFASSEANQSLLDLQIFIGVLAILGLVISALTAELEAFQDSLEKAVETRTIRLERLLSEKDEFLSITVHDLQSPLAGLRNLFGLLRSNPQALASPESTDRLVGEMEAATDDMLGHIDELLRSQKIEAEVEEVESEEVDLRELLSQSVRLQRSNASAKDITMSLELPGVSVHTRTRPKSVQHVLGNLLSNAIKYSPRGSHVTIRFSCSETEAQFDVEDSGPGIPPDQVETLFQKFRRHRARPTGGEKSTGLGLYIVQKMVNQLGGTITCCNLPDGGACFSFVHPLGPDSRIEDLPAHRSATL